jgi:hypothetical protein
MIDGPLPNSTARSAWPSRSPKIHRQIDETIALVDRSISLTASPRLHRHNAGDLVRLRKSMSPESLACVADLIAELQA